MRFTYKANNGKMVEIFYSTYGNTVDVHEHVNGKFREYVRTLREDENGNKFFTWNREKFMLDDFICDTPERLVERIDRNDNTLYGDELCRVLLKHGMESVHVFIRRKPLVRITVGNMSFGMECHSGNEDVSTFPWVEYHFVEEYLHKPIDDYKLKLAPVNKEDQGVYPSKETYVSDLIGLFKACKDEYKVVINNPLEVAVETVAKVQMV